MEHFLVCHEQAFVAIQSLPAKIMVDNLKSPRPCSAWPGCALPFNGRYLDCSRHSGFDIAA